MTQADPAVKPRVVAQFIAAALLSVIVLVLVGLVILTWPNPGAVVPAHWGFTGSPDLMTSSALLWISLIPAAACCGISVLLAVTLRTDATRWAPAAGFAVLALVEVATSMQWPVAQLTAATPQLNNGIGAPFLLYLVAVVWAGLVFILTLARRAE